MGTETSSLKRSPYHLEESIRHTVMNNFSPIAFHDVHGENIRLSHGGTVACRADGFCKGIAFSNRPIKVNERVYIKFADISTSWSGALRIGFTANNPVTFRSSLPRYACPDLTNKPGNWAKALAERFAKKDSVLFYYVDENGSVHYGIDNEIVGEFFSGVNTSSNLWALLDVYGNTRAVEILAPHTLRREDSNPVVNVESFAAPQSSSAHLVKNPILRSNSLSELNIKLLTFHTVHGKNVLLNRSMNMATRKKRSHGLAYLFTSRPVTVDEKVIVQITETDSDYEGSLIFGVTSCNPINICDEDMPLNCDDLLDRPEYWVIWRDRNLCTQGSIMVCNITSNGELQISRNGDPLSTILYVDHTLPLWLFFDLYGATQQICLVGSANGLKLDEVLKLNEIFSKPLTVSLPPSKETCIAEPENTDDCVVCYEKHVDCVLYRCGHMCLCHKCAMEVFKRGAQCPVCRTKIEDVIKTYR